MGARALLLAAVGAQAILLGSGVATSSTDLRTLLAAPPAAGWIEVGAATDVLVGAFTAKSYAAYLRSQGTSPGSSEFTLNLCRPTAPTGGTGARGGRRPRVGRSASRLEIERFRVELGTVFEIAKSGWRLAGAGALAMSFAVWAPLNAFACSATAGSASTAGGGGGLSNPFGPIDPHAATDAILAGFTLSVGLPALAIWVAVAMRRRQAKAIPAAQLSADGRYWWDGAFWRPLPPR